MHVLVSLSKGSEGKVEYIKTIVVARLLWNDWYKGLPPCCLTEEMCEGLLSCVVSMLHRHPNSTALEEVYNLFLITPLPDDHVKDLNSSQLPNALLETARHNLHSVIA